VRVIVLYTGLGHGSQKGYRCLRQAALWCSNPTYPTVFWVILSILSKAPQESAPLGGGGSQSPQTGFDSQILSLGCESLDYPLFFAVTGEELPKPYREVGFPVGHFYTSKARTP
jgi:hypothetical protein